MLTVQVNTFQEAYVKLLPVSQPIETLVIKLHSPYDAPLLMAGMSQQQVQNLAIQTEFLVFPIKNNPNFSQLKQFKLYCHFTLNDWSSFDSLVDTLNSKNDDIQIEFITSVAITQDSFIYKLKNCTGKIQQWQ